MKNKKIIKLRVSLKIRIDIYKTMQSRNPIGKPESLTKLGEPIQILEFNFLSVFGAGTWVTFS
jgi:hypothetical protein